jgi:V/A-type H+-transporting ATPase subunit I
MTPSIVLLSIALVVLMYTLGIVGPLEVFGVVGNILSYSRLMAIGLASVILARVANDLADMVGSVVLGVIVAALLHALNIALGAMSPSIQSARLHYVEFFTKFYKTGGRPFRPFRLSDAAG